MEKETERRRERKSESESERESGESVHDANVPFDKSSTIQQIEEAHRRADRQKGAK